MMKRIPIILSGLLAASFSLLALVEVQATSPTARLYDELQRLTQVTYPDGRQVSYVYDDMDNLVQVRTVTRESVVALVTGPVNGTVGLMLSHQVMTSNNSLVTGYAVRGLPLGLKMNTGASENREGQASGMIYGTPAREGNFTVQVAVRTAAGLGPSVPMAVNIANPFTTKLEGFDLMGAFSGALEPGALEGADLGGWLSLRTSRNGSYSGVLTLGGINYAFKGAFHPVTGMSEPIAISRRNQSNLTLSLTMLLGPLSGEHGWVSVSLGDDVEQLQTHLFREMWSRGLPAEVFAGTKTTRYNTIWQTNPLHSGNEYPQGLGHASIVVNRVGLARLAGRLADGTAFTHARSLWRDGTMPIFVALYGRKGGVVGRWPRFVTGVNAASFDNTVSGVVRWQRPAAARATAALFASGFDTTLNMTGGAYAAPARGQRVLDLGGAVTHPALQLGFARGGLAAPIAAAITLSPTNKVMEINPNTNGIRLRITASTGMVSGTFRKNGKSANFSGLILNSTPVGPAEGYGYFLLPGPDRGSPTLSGSVFIGLPAPD